MTQNFTLSPTIAKADYAGGTLNSVVVSTTATRRLPFSSFLMHRGVTIRAKAQASFKKGGTYRACLTALAQNASNVLDIGGNATVRAQCGLAALSCEDDAIVISGSATVSTNSIATCGTASVPTANESVVTEGVKGLQDIYKNLTPPINNTPQSVNCVKNGKGGNKATMATLNPGTYSGGITVKCATVLNPGIYVIDGGELDLAGNYNVTGTRVMFILKNGARMKFGGNGNGNQITLTPPQAADFVGTPYESVKNDLQGMLVFEDRNNNPGNPGHQLNGNSQSLIEGLIYLPSGEISVLGTADVASQCLQISAYKIKITGNAILETLCPTNSTTQVGYSAAQIRLVG